MQTGKQIIQRDTCCKSEYLRQFPKHYDSECHPKNSFAPGFGRISFDEFLAELLGLADAPSGEPERFLVIQTALLESGGGITQVRFQFAPVVGRKIGLRGQFLPPAFNGGVQIETGLIFHNLLKVL